MECFRLLFVHLAWIEHQFLRGIRDSRKAGRLWGMMRGVGGVRKSIDTSWLAKGLGSGLLYWGFKEVQEEIPSAEANTLVGTRKNFTAAATSENSTVCLYGPMSTFNSMVGLQLLNTMVGPNFTTSWSAPNFSASELELNWMFFKIFQILSPSLLGMTSSKL